MASHSNSRINDNGDDALDQEQEEEEVVTDNANNDNNDHWQKEDTSERDQRTLHVPNLMWLCNDGKYRQADRRFDLLVTHEKHSTLETEIFGKGGININVLLIDTTLGEKVLRYSIERHPAKLRHLLSLQSGEQQQTRLHWACSRCAFDLRNLLQDLKLLVQACPEALLLRDKNNRTPADILQYYCQDRFSYLAMTIHLPVRQTHRWQAHRIRDTLDIGAQRLFSAASTCQDDGNALSLTPFCDKDRKATKRMRRQWFVMSLLGSLMQREMAPLAWHILGFVNTSETIEEEEDNSNKRKRT